MLAMPLTSVVLLHASPSQMGIITALGVLPFVLFSLPGGVLLDRHGKFKVYVGGEMALALLVLAIPVAWWLDCLSIPLMYVFSFCIGTIFTIAGSAAQVVLTLLVGRENLVKANAQNALASSIAEVSGPGLAGLLIRLLGPPMAMLFDVFMLIGSLLLLRGIQVKEDIPETQMRNFKKELLDGLRHVFHHPTLREIAACAASWQFFAQMAMTVEILFAVRELGLSEETTAYSFVALGMGSVVCAGVGTKISRLLGMGASMLFGIALMSVSWLLMLALRGYVPDLMLFVGMLFGFSFGATLMYINMMAMRQSATPDDMLGRVNSSMRWLALIPAAPGALIGGWVAEQMGLTMAIGLGGGGCMLVAIIFSWRPVLRSTKTLSLPVKSECVVKV